METIKSPNLRYNSGEVIKQYKVSFRIYVFLFTLRKCLHCKGSH